MFREELRFTGSEIWFRGVTQIRMSTSLIKFSNDHKSRSLKSLILSRTKNFFNLRWRLVKGFPLSIRSIHSIICLPSTQQQQVVMDVSVGVGAVVKAAANRKWIIKRLESNWTLMGSCSAIFGFLRTPKDISKAMFRLKLPRLYGVFLTTGLCF